MSTRWIRKQKIDKVTENRYVTLKEEDVRERKKGKVFEGQRELVREGPEGRKRRVY